MTDRRAGPPPPNPFEGIRRVGGAAWGVLGVILLAGVAFGLLWLVRPIFPPLALATVIIVFLNPIVTALEKRGIRRTIGTVGMYILFIAVVTLIAGLLAPPLQRQAGAFVERLPEIGENTVDALEGVANRLGVSLEDLGLDFTADGEEAQDPAADGEEAQDPADDGGGVRNPAAGIGLDRLIDVFAGARQFATGAFHFILIFVLGPFLALYLLIDLPKLQKSLVDYLPPRYKQEWILIARRCSDAVGGFFRGQLAVAAIVGVLSSTAFYLLDLPFWLPIGLLAGFFNIIPFVGPFVGGAIAVVVGWVTVGPALAVKAAVAMVAVQQLDNHFISPKVMQRAVKLHPVSVMLALLAGGTLAGFWGVLLGVPALAVAKIISAYYYETRVLGRPRAAPSASPAGVAASPAQPPRRSLAARLLRRGSR